MTNQVNQGLAAAQAAQRVIDLQARFDKFINAGNLDQAERIKPELDQARRSRNIEAARLEALKNPKLGDLWGLAATNLTGGDPVKIHWRKPKIGNGLGATTRINGKRKTEYIEIDPDTVSLDQIFKTFLHECGHCVDFAKNPSQGVCTENREKAANGYRDKWEAYAKKNGGKYAKFDRTNLETWLISLCFMEV